MIYLINICNSLPAPTIPVPSTQYIMHKEHNTEVHLYSYVKDTHTYKVNSDALKYILKQGKIK